MNSVNLYCLSRITDPALFPAYEKNLSGRETMERANEKELLSLRGLVSFLLRGEGGVRAQISDLDGFYFSYTIGHISKEFDLLKLSEDGSAILNIELKSEDIGEQRIREQLLQNRYYLGHITGEISSFTYVLSSDTLYCLNSHSYLLKSSAPELISALKKPALKKYLSSGIERFFDTAGYLISPVGTPEKFLMREYFLTNQQTEIRKKVLAALSGNPRQHIGLFGGAGTGKTLLLYDLALELSRKKKVCLLHCGPLSDAHRLIDERLSNVRIYPFTEENALPDLSGADYLLIDETGRLPVSIFSKLKGLAAARGIPCIYTCDRDRIELLPAEGESLEDAAKKSGDLLFSLSGNIRISRQLASFLRLLFDPKAKASGQDFSGVHFLYAETPGELRRLLSWGRKQGYSHLRPEAPAVGLEYDRIMYCLDGRFYLDGDQCLQSRSDHPRRDLTDVYDALSRAREELLLIVQGNPQLLACLLSLPEA